MHSNVELQTFSTDMRHFLKKIQLIWYNPAEARLCRIYLRKLVNLQDETDWPIQHQWLVEKLDTLHQVFAKRVKQLHM